MRPAGSSVRCVVWLTANVFVSVCVPGVVVLLFVCVFAPLAGPFAPAAFIAASGVAAGVLLVCDDSNTGFVGSYSS